VEKGNGRQGGAEGEGKGTIREGTVEGGEIEGLIRGNFHVLWGNIGCDRNRKGEKTSHQEKR